eukprot:5122520-Heterocapsa_arctica.AAC.1
MPASSIENGACRPAKLEFACRNFEASILRNRAGPTAGAAQATGPSARPAGWRSSSCSRRREVLKPSIRVGFAVSSLGTVLDSETLWRITEDSLLGSSVSSSS